MKFNAIRFMVRRKKNYVSPLSPEQDFALGSPILLRE